MGTVPNSMKIAKVIPNLAINTISLTIEQYPYFHNSQKIVEIYLPVDWINLSKTLTY